MFFSCILVPLQVKIIFLCISLIESELVMYASDEIVDTALFLKVKKKCFCK